MPGVLGLGAHLQPRPPRARADRLCRALQRRKASPVDRPRCAGAPPARDQCHSTHLPGRSPRWSDPRVPQSSLNRELSAPLCLARIVVGRPAVSHRPGAYLGVSPFTESVVADAPMHPPKIGPIRTGANSRICTPHHGAHATAFGKGLLSTSPSAGPPGLPAGARTAPPSPPTPSATGRPPERRT